MSHIEKSGRPAKAGREWPADNTAGGCAWSFWLNEGIESSHPSLVWRVPFQEIVEKIQTVDGIAKLAGVTRKTVYRRKIQVGGWAAFSFVLDRLRGRPSALVTHTDPNHRVNAGLRLKTPRSWLNRGVLDVVAACDNYFKNGTRTSGTLLMPPVTEGEPVSKIQKELNTRFAIKRANWKRRLKHHPDVNPNYATNAELEELKKAMRLGKTRLYKPLGKVTAKMLCGFFDISRSEFYRWRDSLSPHELSLLKAAMNPPQMKVAPEINDLESVAEPEGAESQPEGGRRFEVDLNSEGGSRFATVDSD